MLKYPYKVSHTNSETEASSQFEIGSDSEEPILDGDMSPEEKIAKVLKQIKNEAAINPDPRLMNFELNNHIVGAGILTDDEERRILLKLEKEGVIGLRLSQYKDTQPKEVSVISSYEGERFMTSPYYWVEMLDGFDEKYEIFSKYLVPEKTKRTKWRSDHMPIGYPQESSSQELRDVLQDLSEEFDQKIKNGKINVIWEKQIRALQESGRYELDSRAKTAGSHSNVFISARNIVNSGSITGSEVNAISSHDTNKQPQLGFLERITNNQTIAIIIGTLFVLGVVYAIYHYSGINLSQFR